MPGHATISGHEDRTVLSYHDAVINTDEGNREEPRLDASIPPPPRQTTICGEKDQPLIAGDPSVVDVYERDVVKGQFCPALHGIPRGEWLFFTC